MISACTDTAQQDPLIERYMMLPNQVWDDIINQASKNVDVLKDHVSPNNKQTHLKKQKFEEKKYFYNIDKENL